MIRELLKKNRFIVGLYQKMIGYKQGNEHWCRVVMDRETEKLARSLPFAQLNALEISGNKWSGFGFKSYASVFFPEFDICKERTAGQYDLIIAEQVFEHLKWPYKAAKNVYEMLKPGGYFLITIPFMIKIHHDPIDCSRWTALGLSYFLEEAGFDHSEIVADSWGNRDCVVGNFDEWMPYNPAKHSLENEKDFPLVVWALARKK